MTFYLNQLDDINRERLRDYAREAERDRLLGLAEAGRGVARGGLARFFAQLRQRLVVAFRTGPRASVAPLPLRRGGRLRTPA